MYVDRSRNVLVSTVKRVIGSMISVQTYHHSSPSQQSISFTPSSTQGTLLLISLPVEHRKLSLYSKLAAFSKLLAVDRMTNESLNASNPIPIQHEC